MASLLFFMGEGLGLIAGCGNTAYGIERCRAAARGVFWAV